MTLGDRGGGDSRVGIAAAEEELRAEDASVLHCSAPGLQPEIIEAGGSGTRAEQLRRLLAAGPLPETRNETDRGHLGPTRTLSLEHVEKKFSHSKRTLLGSFDGVRVSEHGLSASLRQVHQNPPKMSGLANNSSTKSRQKANGAAWAAAAYHTGPTPQKSYLAGVAPHLRNAARQEKNRPYASRKPSNLSLNSRSALGSAGSARSGYDLGEASKTSSAYGGISLPTAPADSGRKGMTTLMKSPYF